MGSLEQPRHVRCAICKNEVELASGERIAFRDTCERCGTDLHTCIHCTHHDPAAYNSCREPNAERVSDPERANRCEWFSPAANPSGGASSDRDEARSRLEGLFKK